MSIGANAKAAPIRGGKLLLLHEVDDLMAVASWGREGERLTRYARMLILRINCQNLIFTKI